MPHPELAIEFGSRRDPLHPVLVPTATTSWQKERAERRRRRRRKKRKRKRKGRRRAEEGKRNELQLVLK